MDCQVAPNLWADRFRPPYPTGGNPDRLSPVNSDPEHHPFGVEGALPSCGWRAFVRGAIPRAAARASLLAACLAGASLGLPSFVSAQRMAPPVRTLLGDVAIILRPEVDGALAVGVAGPTRALTLTVRASDARRWADSAARLSVAPPRARNVAKGGKGRTGGKGGAAAVAGASAPNDSARRARVVLEEPGVGAGSLVLSRVDSAGTRTFLLFADDSELDPIRQPLTLAEARTLVRLVQRAAAPIPARRPRR